jgi:hypothetical protein
MPLAGLEPTIPVFKRAKTFHALDRAATVTGLTSLPKRWSRDSSVGIATGWAAGVRFRAESRDFSLLHSSQTGPGARPASYPMDTGGSFPGGKAAGREIHHSRPSSAEVNNDGAVPPLPNTSSWRGA